MHLLGLWSHRQSGWLRRGVAWLCSSKSERKVPASETPPCWVSRESVWGWIVDWKSTCNCTTASSPREEMLQSSGHLNPPPPTAAWWFTVWAPAASYSASFFPLTNYLQIALKTQKVKSLKQKKKITWSTRTEEIIKKIKLKPIKRNQVLKSTRDFQYCEMVHIHWKNFLNLIFLQ